jgi:hypothetical protein
MTGSVYKIYFAETLSIETADLTTPAIVLAPVSDRWNDFGHRTRFDFKVLSNLSEVQFEGQLRLGFLDVEYIQSGARAVISRDLEIASVAGKSLVGANAFPEFFTMLLDMNGYREIVGRMGPKGAERVLLELNDLVAVRARSNPKWLGGVVRSKEFHLAFMRHKGTFFAFHNAGSLLGGLVHESLDGLSKDLRLEFKLASFQNPHVVRFEFEPSAYVPKRIAIIIGKNGVGKSQALRQIATALLNGDLNLTTGDGGPPIVNRLLAVSSPGETAGTFPSKKRRSPIQYERIVLSGPPGRKTSGLGEVLVRLARSEESIKGKKRWELFIDALSSIVPIDDLFVVGEKKMQG